MIDRMVRLPEPAHMARLPKPADESEIRFLGDVQRMSLKPGDILVVSVDGYITEADAEAIKTNLSPAFPGHRVIVLPKGTKIGVMAPA